MKAIFFLAATAICSFTYAAGIERGAVACHAQDLVPAKCTFTMLKNSFDLSAEAQNISFDLNESKRFHAARVNEVPVEKADGEAKTQAAAEFFAKMNHDSMPAGCFQNLEMRISLGGVTSEITLPWPTDGIKTLNSKSEKYELMISCN